MLLLERIGLPPHKLNGALTRAYQRKGAHTVGYVKIRRKVGDALSCVCLLAVASGLVIFPSQMVSAAKDGVDMCFNVIIPSLFPFFVLSSLTVELGVAEKLGRLLAPLMRPLFNVGGACASALVLGFIGGYPVGAKTVINLYENGECSKTEAERMLSFCNNSGPAFIFGVVGAGIFSSGTIGLILYLAHIAASVCVGLVFRRWGSGGITRHEASIPRATTPFLWSPRRVLVPAVSSIVPPRCFPTDKTSCRDGRIQSVVPDRHHP